ncbi:MAG: hypothetical protein DRQ78_01340 [Epsilonproteobacteria bacterium]|nr:MAG: hypothetical protein DRQ78_01340 [Campylobacterota bacterium]
MKIAEENVNSKMSYFNTLNTLLNDIGYFDFYKDTEQDKMSNIRVILQQISQEFTDETSTKAKASEFFRAIALISSSDANDEMNKVSLLTAHASKGTEYEVVFCVD